MELFVIRHGETDWNRARRWQGREDIPLNECGRAQALQSAARLEALGLSYCRILTSTLRRAYETAQIIAGQLDIPEIVSDERLIERDLGQASGMVVEEVNRLYPTRDIPGYEPEDIFEARLHACLRAYACDGPDEALPIVTHGGVIRKMLREAGAEELLKAPLNNGAIFRFAFQNNALRYEGMV